MTTATETAPAPTIKWTPGTTLKTLLLLMEPTAGVWIRDMPMPEYLAVDAMSASGLRAFRRSPAHYRRERLYPDPPTDAMKKGTALHTALLEPEKFDETYVVLGLCKSTLGSGNRKGEPCGSPGTVRRFGIDYCGRHDPMKGEDPEPGLEVVQVDWMEEIAGMKAAVLRHPEASQYFRGRVHYEVVGLWKDPATGVLCKIRLDMDPERVSVHADLKATGDASEEGFYWQTRRMGYGEKAAWYRRVMAGLGRPAIGSVLIAVEWKPNLVIDGELAHGCVTHLLDEEEDLPAWGRDIDGMLARYSECVESGAWSGYPDGLRPMKMKPFHLPEVEFTEDAEDEEEF